MGIFDIFRNTDIDFKIKERVINPLYIKDETQRNHYIKYGYTIVNNVVPDEIIQKVLAFHDKISEMPGYFNSDKLETTIAFGEEIHTLAINTIKELSESIFAEILDSKLCMFDFGGGIIIKNKGCWFAPHQDCSIVDEYTTTTTYAWIPTVDMNDLNGTFYAIPGSHLWAAWQRSSQYGGWPLKTYNKLLWEQMIPLYVKKGDILLFDSALIHASGENKTNQKRIAFNACIIDKNAQHVQYVLDKDTPKGKVEKYLVDFEYWYKGNLWGRPQGYERIIENTLYPDYISKEFLLNQIQKFNPDVR